MNIGRSVRSGLTMSLLWLGAVSIAAQGGEPGVDRGAIGRLIRQGDHAKALEAIDAGVARAPADARLWTLKGLVLSGLKRDPEALAAYRKALALDPKSLPALQGAAEIEYRTRRPEAKGTIERILAIEPGSLVAHAMLGSLAFERQDCEGAVAAFERSGPALDRNGEALEQFAHCLYVVGRYLDAASTFDRRQLLAPGETGPRIKAALALQAAGRFGEALARVEPLAAGPAADPAVIDLAADLYDSLDRVSEAVALLREAVARTPAQESHYVTLGSICLKRESYDLAREIVDVGLRHIPRSAALHTIRGVVHAQLGDTTRAAEDFETATRLRPDRPLGGVGQSLALQQAGQIEESIVLLRREAAGNPNDAPTLFLLAQALVRAGVASGTPAAQEAEGALRRAVEAAPNFGEAHAELGKLYLKLGQPGRAVEHLRRAISLTPGDRTATYSLLLALRQAGLVEETPAVAARLRELMAQEREDEVSRNRFRLLKAEDSR